MIPVCEPYLAGNEVKYVSQAVQGGWISSSGSFVKEFESSFANYCEAKYAISVCNGTVALHLALKALGIKEGDEVIIPDFTMIACAFAVCYCGATPVFVDASLNSWNIDTKKIESAITERTKAIMAVHIFGVPCNMDEIRAIAKKRGCFVIEDCAEAHGALYQGKKVGVLSDIACFSFFANKNITTGEGGMVVTNNEELANKCRYFKNLCFPLDKKRTYLHDEIGFNYRMSNIQAALGVAQVEKADFYRDIKRKIGQKYKRELSKIKGVSLQASNDDCVFWMNGVYLNSDFGKSRDYVVDELFKMGIETRNFFNGMHRQLSLKNYGCNCRGDFPVSDMLADNGFYLPSSCLLQDSQIDYICSSLEKIQKS